MAFTVVDFPTAALAAAAVRSVHCAPLPDSLGAEVGTLPTDDPPVEAKGAEEAEGFALVGLPALAQPDNNSPDAMVTAMMIRDFIAFFPLFTLPVISGRHLTSPQRHTARSHLDRTRIAPLADAA